MTNPLLEEQQQHFDAIADDYIHRLGGEELHDYYQKMGSDYVLNALRKGFPDLHTLRGLELGCGIGDTTIYFDDCTRETQGVDFAAEMIRVAERRHRRKRFFQGWFQKLPLKDHSLDFVFSFGTFHHLLNIDEYRATIREAFRVLAPGGMILISDTNPWNPLTKIIARSGHIDLGTEHFFSRREAMPLYREAGFRNVHITDYGFIPHFFRPLSRLDGVFSRAKVFVFGRYQLITARKP